MSITKVKSNAVKEIADQVNVIVDEFGAMNGEAIVVTTATKTLLPEESGAVIILSKADGIVLTLPTPKVGLKYKVNVLTSVTSNAYTVNTDAATTLFAGGPLTCLATAVAPALFVADESNDDAFSMNGTTTGGLKGTTLEFLCVSATRWLVTGVNVGSGTLATSFS